MINSEVKPIASETNPSAEAAKPKGYEMPTLRSLISVAATANAPLIAWFLLLAQVRPAIGLLSGLALGIVVHSILYMIVTAATKLFGGSPANPTGHQKQGQTAGFAGLMVGKFVIIVALFYTCVSILHVNLFWLMAGFLITQAAMTGATVLRLARTKVTD